jgi:hypothetical protein
VPKRNGPSRENRKAAILTMLMDRDKIPFHVARRRYHAASKQQKTRLGSLAQKKGYFNLSYGVVQ